jgi:hypothetical protein
MPLLSHFLEPNLAHSSYESSLWLHHKIEKNNNLGPNELYIVMESLPERQSQ